MLSSALIIQLTLKHGFELCSSTYKGFFFFSSQTTSIQLAVVVQTQVTQGSTPQLGICVCRELMRILDNTERSTPLTPHYSRVSYTSFGSVRMWAWSQSLLGSNPSSFIYQLESSIHQFLCFYEIVNINSIYLRVMIDLIQVKCLELCLRHFKFSGNAVCNGFLKYHNLIYFKIELSLDLDHSFHC